MFRQLNIFMEEAILQAYKAFEEDEVPVGAVIVDRATKSIVARAHNLVEKHRNVICHAEILAINSLSASLNRKFLHGHDIYVTLEPCAMCASAISYARIDRIFFGAHDAKFGAVESSNSIFRLGNSLHKPEIYGDIMAGKSQKLLKTFFINKRKKLVY